MRSIARWTYAEPTVHQYNYARFKYQQHPLSPFIIMNYMIYVS